MNLNQADSSKFCTSSELPYPFIPTLLSTRGLRRYYEPRITFSGFIFFARKIRLRHIAPAIIIIFVQLRDCERRLRIVGPAPPRPAPPRPTPPRPATKGSVPVSGLRDRLIHFHPYRVAALTSRLGNGSRSERTGVYHHTTDRAGRGADPVAQASAARCQVTALIAIISVDSHAALLGTPHSQLTHN